MSFEPIEEMTEESEKSQSWLSVITNPSIIVALLALLSFIAIVTANFQYMPKK